MNVKQLYEKYRIPKNLQEHMLRVGVLAQIISENWIGREIDKLNIVVACLFHDAGKIVKFDFSRLELFGEEAKNIDYWKQVQNETIKKYGEDEHTTNYKLCGEMGLKPKILEIIKNLEWDDVQKLLDAQNLDSAIPVYCDMRIGPFGILSIDDRINDLKNRVGERNYDVLFELAHVLENRLQENVKTDLKSINNSQINERFEDLMEMKVV